MRLVLLLLVGACGALSWWTSAGASIFGKIEPVLTNVCSENPYYAQAEIVLDWYGSHPESAPSYAQGYSHAVLDSKYASLYEQGLVPPVPPPCKVTALAATPIYDYVGGNPLAELAAGSVGDLYGRSADSAWWAVWFEGVGWGWVRAQDVTLQSGTQLDQIPLR